MDFALIVCFALFVLAFYLWARVSLAHILAEKLTGEILHITPSERPFLLVLIGLVLGRMPSQKNLAHDLTAQWMQAGVISMLWQYRRAQRSLQPLRESAGGR